MGDSKSSSPGTPCLGVFCSFSFAFEWGPVPYRTISPTEAGFLPGGDEHDRPVHPTVCVPPCGVRCEHSPRPRNRTFFVDACRLLCHQESSTATDKHEMRRTPRRM